MPLHVVAASVALALPLHGTLVPGRTLGGLRVGSSAAHVRAAWGTRYGICRGCSRRTWYFTYTRYQPQGAGVEFRNGRVVALFTLWSPTGWRTSDGLRIGDPPARIERIYGPLTKLDCGTYDAYELPRGRLVTTFYVFAEKVWGFALSRSDVPVCR